MAAPPRRLSTVPPTSRHRRCPQLRPRACVICSIAAISTARREPGASSALLKPVSSAIRMRILRSQNSFWRSLKAPAPSAFEHYAMPTKPDRLDLQWVPQHIVCVTERFRHSRQPQTPSPNARASKRSASTNCYLTVISDRCPTLARLKRSSTSTTDAALQFRCEDRQRFRSIFKESPLCARVLLQQRLGV